MATGDPAWRRKDGAPVVDQPMPARGVTRTRPPFEPGNTMAVKHGAYSERAIAVRAEQVRELLEQYAPELASPLWAGARAAYCWNAARAELIQESIARTVSETGDIANVKPSLLQEASRVEALVDKLRGDLGLTPAGAARITRDLHLANRGRQLPPSDGPQLGERGRALRTAQGRHSDGS